MRMRQVVIVRKRKRNRRANWPKKSNNIGQKQ